MKKLLSIALILGATSLLACPMQQGGGMMEGGMCKHGMMSKCQCDTSKLPKAFENLGLNNDQKAQIQKLREEGKAFHNQHQEKMMAVLTPDQRKKLEANVPAMCPKGDMKMPQKGEMKMPQSGMTCQHCKK